MSDGHLLGHGDRQPLFEGFPLSGEGRDPVGADRRILSSRRQSVIWRSVLGRLSSLCHMVPGGRLRLRSLQLLLRQQWDFVDKSVVPAWSPEVASDLDWWSDASHLLSGVCLMSQQLDVLFWSNASDHGCVCVCMCVCGGGGGGGESPRSLRFKNTGLPVG